MSDNVLMPSGENFAFWDDATAYTRVYHVACGQAGASDDNPGSAEQPLLTINRAAQLVQPGEKVVVHAGVYRELVRPLRGGEGPERMIAYEAAPGEDVQVRGSRVWQPDVRPSVDAGVRAEQPPIWMADLPAEWFVGYNPFVANNIFLEFIVYPHPWTTEELQTFFKKRGMVFYQGQPLRQVYFARDLVQADGAFWVDDDGLRLHFRLPGDRDPHGAELEVTTQEQVFAPAEKHLGYIRVSGFHFAHAANGIPVPQHGLLSTTRGHHWIVEDCTVRWANAVGMDFGAQDWKIAPYTPNGHHIIRRNTVADCGICGIAGVLCVDHTLVEDNVLERIGGLNVERCFECAALKFHVVDSALFRRNIFRHLHAAAGLWLDVGNRNCRITNNVFLDIATAAGAAYIECSHAVNCVDHNLFFDIRDVADPRYRSDALAHRGIGVNFDTGENGVVAHNLFINIPDYSAVDLGLAQQERNIGGRYGLCRRHQVRNNIFVACPHRIHLGQPEEQGIDGNLYDQRDRELSFWIEYPQPGKRLTLPAWRSYFGFDANGTEVQLTAQVDPATLTVRLHATGDLPTCPPVDALHGEAPPPPAPSAPPPGRKCKPAARRCSFRFAGRSSPHVKEMGIFLHKPHPVSPEGAPFDSPGWNPGVVGLIDPPSPERATFINIIYGMPPFQGSVYLSTQTQGSAIAPPWAIEWRPFGAHRVRASAGLSPCSTQ